MATSEDPVHHITNVYVEALLFYTISYSVAIHTISYSVATQSATVHVHNQLV